MRLQYFAGVEDSSYITDKHQTEQKHQVNKY